MSDAQRVDVEKVQKFVPAHSGGGMVAVITNAPEHTYIKWTDCAALLQQVAELEERLAMADHMAVNTQGYLQSRESELANEKLCSDDLALRLIETQEERDSLRRQLTDAERAREAACGLLRKIDSMVPAEILGPELCDELDAFLAANGGAKTQGLSPPEGEG